MAPYRAGSGGGLFGSYAYPDSRPRVDIGGALDALGNTATSLISQAYQRKIGQQQLALEQQRVSDERQRYAQDYALRQQEQRFREGEANRAHDLAIANLATQGFVPDDESLTASAYGASPSGPSGAAPAATPMAATPAGPATTPRYTSLLQRGFETARMGPGPSADVAVPAAAAPPPASRVRTTDPTDTRARLSIGGQRFVYDPRKSAAAAAESQRESFEKEQAQAAQSFQMTLEKARAGDERALEAVKYMHEQNLIPIKAQADADAFLRKQDYAQPTQDETTAATQLPEMIKSHQILQELGKPDLVTTLSHKYGNLGKALQSPEGQRFVQAAKQFSITGTLATEGARFNPEKQKASDEMFIPTNWNDPTVLAQIAASREQRIRDAAMKSGRAFSRLPLETQQYLTDSLGYKPIRGQMPAPASAPAPSAAPPVAPTASGRRVVNPAQLRQQRADYDAAVAHLKQAGKTDADITAELGARP